MPLLVNMLSATYTSMRTSCPSSRADQKSELHRPTCTPLCVEQEGMLFSLDIRATRADVNDGTNNLTSSLAVSHLKQNKSWLPHGNLWQQPPLTTSPPGHFLAPWSVLDPFMRCVLNYTHVQHLIGWLDMEHMWNDQLVHLDKTQYIILYFC